MNLKICFSFVLLLLLNGSLFGQSKLLKSKSRTTPEQKLEQARSIFEENPKEAIYILDGILNQKTKKRNYKLDAEAYMLLGDIYHNIDQKKLALSRYHQALVILKKTKFFEEKAKIYYKMGVLHLALENADDASGNFIMCIKFKNSSFSQLCEEGLADVEFLKGNTANSISRLNFVQSQYSSADSLANSRLEAKISQNYTRDNDYDNAYESLKKSVDNLPKNKEVEKKDYKEIEKAKEGILASPTFSNAEKIDVNINTLPPTSGVEPKNEATVKGNLQVAALYEKENKLLSAEKYINKSKEAIDSNTSAASKSEVYKKSAEINQKRGKITAALKDLEKYIEAKEQSIVDSEEELNEQIEIVKSQRNIDLGVKDLVLEEKDQQILQNQLGTQKWIIGLLSLLLGTSLIFFYSLNKNVKEKRRANQLLLLKSLRTQMNPHFIFNALNSVNNFIAKNDEKAANKFLSDFSKLMRKVLDHSQVDLVSFEDEMELNELYLKLEHFRFRDKFDYQLERNFSDTINDLKIPPMLIQPFIENAVWHGLRYKEEKGNLKVAIDEKEDHLVISIVDDGIGRERSKAIKTSNQKKYKSTGLENVSNRVALINEVYNKNYKIEIDDASPSSENVGTSVHITIPK